MHSTYSIDILLVRARRLNLQEGYAPRVQTSTAIHSKAATERRNASPDVSTEFDADACFFKQRRGVSGEGVNYCEF